MKLKLHHPLWVHFPAVIFLVIIVANIILARPLWHSHVITRYGPTGIPSATISNG